MAVTAEKRSLGAAGRMGVVMSMHLALLLLLMRGMGIRIPVVEGPRDITTTVIDEHRTQEDPPPVAFPHTDIPIWMPEPDRVTVEQDPPVKDRIVGETHPGGGETGSGSAVPQPQIVGVRVDAHHPLTQPSYPAARIRFNDEGAVELEIYVLPDGRVGDARVLKSSGFEDFDRAALQEARRSWRLLPATRDGRPLAQWYSLRVVFKLKNAH